MTIFERVSLGNKDIFREVHSKVHHQGEEYLSQELCKRALFFSHRSLSVS